jgi:ABC-2 type transport system ATP-binding protein
MSAISFRKVAKRYGATQALADLSLDVREGEMFGLIGPDGAGKTTAIRLMCGLLHADAGELRVLGLDPVKDHHGITERVGYLSQRFSLYGDLTIDENIGFFAEVHGVRDYHRRREQLLSMTQLTPFRDRLADRLSGGMKQKLALACTLVHEPHLILLDEPTTGVDPISRREFWKLLSEFLAHGITILMSTPYLDEAERCSRVAYAQVFGERVHVTLEDGGEAAEAEFRSALAATPLAGVPVRPVTPSLEDVFIARLSGEESAHA